MPADDALDYHPNERRTTAVTARGRRVNRLQLCEEDHSEDNAETGNRRSKHHNPWSVLSPGVTCDRLVFEARPRLLQVESFRRAPGVMALHT